MTDSLVSLLRDLKAHGCRVWAEGDKLKVRTGAGGMPEELKETLRARKAELLAYLATHQAIPRLPENAPIPLSLAQQRLWLLTRLDDPSAAYHLPVAFTLETALDEAALRRAGCWLVARHQSLRLCFTEVDGEAVAREIPPYDPLRVTDLLDLSAEEQRDAVENLARKHATEPFDLVHGPLMRVHVLRTVKPVVLFNMHHLISDGWSMNILVREWTQAYAAFAQDKTPELAPPPITYADYAAWQRNGLQGEGLQRQLSFWRKRLQDAPELLELATDFSRPPVQSHQGARQLTSLPPPLLQALKQQARDQHSTLFTLLLTAFYLLLHRHSGQQDLVVGTPVANRGHPQTENLIGFFVNTLPLRVILDPNQRVSDLLATVQQTLRDAQAHPDIPLETLVEKLNPRRSLSHTPIFQTLLVLQDDPEPASLPIEFLPQDTAAAKFDLSLDARERDGALWLEWEYATDLFRPARIARMAEHFANLLEAMVENPTRAIRDLPRLTAWEQDQLAAWNQTEVEFDKSVGMVDLFDRQVARAPENLALLFENQTWTYRELAALSARVAHRLLADLDETAGEHFRVGVSLPRSPLWVASVLAIFRLGGVYVPLDPSYPDERIAFILDDCQAQVVLTKKTSPALNHTIKIITLKDEWDKSPALGPPVAKPPGTAAYLIYTSGSTGQPKGVVGTHAGLLNRLHWMWRFAPFAPHERLAAKTAIGFVDSLWELFGGLLQGIPTVVVSEKDSRDLVHLSAVLAQQHVTRLVVVPSLLSALIDLPDAARKLAGIQQWTSSGEALSPALARRFYQVWPDSELLNLYGCSEVAADALFWPVPRDAQEVRIGRPLPNLRTYVLDEWNQPQPLGVPGELAFAGVGLAAGYFRHGDSERFVECAPWGKPERLFKTGDRARWRDDGQLEFLGRRDQQVKLRGARVELGEVEEAMARHPGIREAVAVVATRDEVLVAYCALVDKNRKIPKNWREWLRKFLPEVMIPTFCLPLEAWPLNPHGKIDRLALAQKPLPAPEETEHLPLVSDSEYRLATLWSEVLQREIHKANADFFEFGGHSLLAMKLAARMAREFGGEVPPRSLFEYPRLRDLAAWLDTRQPSAKLPAISPQSPNAPRVVAPAQQRLWFITRLTENAPTYNLALALRLTGYLDLSALRQSAKCLVERHQSLRLCFPDQAGAPSVRECASYDPLVVEDFSASDVETWCREKTAEPFDLDHGPLCRLRLRKTGEHEHVLHITLHHLIADGWSLGLLAREWSRSYRAFRQGETPRLEPLPIQYTDYAAWQRDFLDSDAARIQRAYWQQQLRDAPTVLDLPLDFPRPANPSQRGARHYHRLSPNLSRDWNQLGREHGGTLFMTLHAAFTLLLHRYTGQADPLVGTPLANRGLPQVENLIGLFVNTVILRAPIHETQTFPQWLAQVKTTALDAFAHGDLPFETLVEQLNPERDLSHAPLFQVMFVLHNQELGDLNLPDLAAEILPQASPGAKLDLILAAQETADGIELAWEYATDLFRAERIQAMAANFETLLQGILDRPDEPLASLPLLHPSEIARLQAWNPTADPASDATLASLFEAQATATPDQTAVVFEQQRLTYRELNQAANQLAYFLLEPIGDQANPPIALCCQPAPEQIIALLAITKAGAAYVPLDPEAPAERLGFMLRDSQAILLLTQRALLPTLPDERPQTVCLDQSALFSNHPTVNPPRRADPKALAYVIYTSGSTGQPKGVMIEHAAVCNTLRQRKKAYADLPLARFLQLLPIAFDGATAGIFGALTSGHCLYLGTLALAREVDRLADFLRQHRITHFTLAPLQYAALLAHCRELPDLKMVITGGEASPTRLLADHFARPNPPALCNHYGPTECAIVTTMYRFRAASDAGSWIGRPLPGTRVFILDEQLRPVPAGNPGELCIAGAGLARGYLNRPDLTGKTFREVEIFGENQRVYRSGDLARWRPDGILEYLGRLDHQIKLRGFRIELGEIENALRQLPEVDEVVVVALTREEIPFLAAYVTPTGETEVTLAVVREKLRLKIPEYMLPTTCTWLPRMPLLPSGKVDRRKLPEPEMEKTNGEPPPRTEWEQQLAELWSEVLQKPVSSLDADFFALGGHSLLAARLVARMRDRLQREISIRALFEHPRLGDFAAWLERQPVRALDTIPRLADDAPRVPSPAQQRLWFLHRLEGANYHLPVALRLRGPLDETALRTALTQLIARHPGLRLTFLDSGEVVQEILPYDPWVVTDGTEWSDDERQAEIERLAREHATEPFDLAQGPLVRARLLRLNSDERVLLITLHHIIADGASLAILLREWNLLYRGESLPPPPSIRYTDYAAWQRQWLQQEAARQQREYWLAQLADAPELLELPTDFPRPPRPSFRGGRVYSQLEGEVTESLNHLAQVQGCTRFVAVLAIFSTLLHRYTGQADLLVGTPMSNRDRGETENLVGLMVNTVVVRARFAPETTFSALLAQLRTTVVEAQTHGELPFEDLVERLRPSRSLGHSPLFQVLFSWQGADESTFSLPGVSAEVLEIDHPVARFDLTLEVRERENGLDLEWEFASDLFRAERMERMAAHFQVLARGLVNHPQDPLHALPLLTAEETRQSLAWNQTARPWPEHQTLVEAFEAQVARAPTAIALEMTDGRLDYQTLNQRANRLAGFWLTQPRNEQPIAVFLERGAEMLIALLAILKAGRAYLPLDPTHPPSRIGKILAHAEAGWVLTQEPLRARLPQTQTKVTCLETFDGESFSPQNPPRQANPENAAYLMYTSGSTGDPKGVLVEHRALFNLLLDMGERIGFQSNQKMLALTTLAFDIAALEWFLPLIHGGSVVLARDAQTPKTLAEDLARVDYAQATPATWRMLADSGWQPDSNLSLLCGGEALADNLGQFLATHARKCWNVYGPTETTIWSTVREIPRDGDNAGWIGRPLANTQAWILDAHDQPLPPGIPGELCLAGAGLARGYWRDAERTAQAFPTREIVGQRQRIYRTGDRARWLANGQLEYLGRADRQIKLRGFRIELAEIEAVLRRHPAVDETVVVTRGNEEKRFLAAFVTVNQTVAENELTTWARQSLPDYMVPARVTILATWPRTPNGKIDHAALPDPARNEAKTRPPRDEWELGLVEIWEDVLGVSPIHPTDHFFDLGGHSLLAVRLMRRIEQRFGQTLPLASLFQAPTVAELAALLREQNPAASPEWIALRGEGEGPPIFFLPGLGGNVFDLYPLARALDRPVYAPLARGLDGEAEPERDFEALVADYLRRIRQPQPHGPYTLLGYSFGALVAHALAQALLRAGEKVERLVVIDALPPGAPREKGDAREAFQAYLAANQEILEEDGTDQATLVKNGHAWFAVFQAQYRMEYAEDFAPVPICLFRRHDVDLNHPARAWLEQEDWGWRAHGPVTVQVLEGDHFNLLRPPRVETLAAHLRECFNSKDDRHES